MLKDPDEVLDFAVDWAKELTDKGDTAASVTWTVPTGLVKQADNLTGAKAVIWLSSGVDGSDYAVTCHLTTTGGRQYDRTLRISVRQR